MNLKAIKMEKAIIRIEEEIKALRIEIQYKYQARRTKNAQRH
jgi:hypothetical protein